MSDKLKNVKNLHISSWRENQILDEYFPPCSSFDGERLELSCFKRPELCRKFRKYEDNLWVESVLSYLQPVDDKGKILENEQLNRIDSYITYCMCTLAKYFLQCYTNSYCSSKPKFSPRNFCPYCLRRSGAKSAATRHNGDGNCRLRDFIEKQTKNIRARGSLQQKYCVIIDCFEQEDEESINTFQITIAQIFYGFSNGNMTDFICRSYLSMLQVNQKMISNAIVSNVLCNKVIVSASTNKKDKTTWNVVCENGQIISIAQSELEILLHATSSAQTKRQNKYYPKNSTMPSKALLKVEFNVENILFAKTKHVDATQWTKIYQNIIETATNVRHLFILFFCLYF